MSVARDIIDSSRVEGGRITFIVNPVSGVRENGKLKKIIESIIDPARFNICIEYTRYPGHASEIARGIEKQGIVVAVGGDGTVNEIVREIAGTELILGIVPVGSGNGLARHLHISLHVEKALHVINAGKFTRIDTGVINGLSFVNIAGVGFDGKMARAFSQSRKRGLWGYLINFFKEFPGYKPKEYTLETNGETITTRALFIAFANSDQFGYNTIIAPDADIRDGMLDICIVRKPFFVELPLIAGLLFWRAAQHIPQITVIKANHAHVTMRKKRYCNIDGEAIRLGREIGVSIRPLSLSVIIP